jgi:hypothetical protein
MNRTLIRPMFRMGGAAEGITSGLDRKPLKQGTDPYDRALKTTERFRADMDKFRGETQPMMPGGLPNFLTSFGLNLLSQTPRGNIFATAATAAKEPFQTFQAAQLAERQDTKDQLTDMFGTALASEYDLEAQRIKANAKTDDDRKTPEVERGIIETAQNNIFAARDILKNENSTKEQKLNAERTIKVNQNVLVKELGVPAEYAAIISSAELFDAEMDAVVATFNDKNQKLAEEYMKENPDVPFTEVLKIYPQIEVGTAQARALTIEDLKNRFFYAEGGRAGFKFGSPKEPKMMESVAEQPKGEVQDLSYTELRARLPQEISNDIVMLLANSKQALLDFANIQTTEDIASFNQQYDVNLSMPSGA